MVARLQGTGEALRSPFPWVALGVALALTAAGWLALERSHREDARVRFERRSESTAAELRAHVIAYEQALRASAAHIAASRELTRLDWNRYAGHLRIQERLPGVAAIGFAEVVHGDGVPDLARVIFSDSLRRRQAVPVGVDLAADAVRQRALERARTSGEAATTARITLPVDRATDAPGSTAGFMMFVPIYRELADELPQRERGNAMEGYMFGAFAVDELVRASVGDSLQVLDLRVYDEAAGQNQVQLADTRGPGTESSEAVFQRVVHFPMPGHNWTLQFMSRPQFDQLLRAEAPWGELGGGLMGSALVFLLVTTLMEAWNRTHNLSVRDPLTGLYNRRYLEETMSRELPRALRLGQTVGVIALDLDNFKQLNDTHGHDAGDFVLTRFGELLRNVTRGGDIACRIGGEEFAVILPGTTLEIAGRRADAIRAAFNDIAFQFEGRALGRCTLSAGVAALSPGQADWAAALREADRALYAAKQAGRNRVVTAE